MLKRTLIALWLTGTVAACGFQLQGQQRMPASLATVYLDAADRQSEFTHSLQARLTAAGARLAPRAGPGVATVHISRDVVDERVLSVDARNIPTDYELTYEVEVEVRRDGQVLLASEPFSLTQIYSFDERRALAKEREKEVLLEALARDMASVVARRLAAL